MIEPTPFQSRILKIPEVWNVLLAGGRGGGKTHGMALRVLRHLHKYGPAAKVLIVRENYKGLQTVEELLITLLERAYPGGVKFNRQDHLARIADGGTVEFGQIESHRDVSKFMGRETTLLCVDEAGLLKDMKWITLLKSNLRSPTDIPLSVIMTANPGSNQHAYLYRHYVAAALPWHPFVVDGETWVHCPSTLRDNPHLDHEDYSRRIRAACSNDSELAAAWISGDWSALNRGAFFGLEFDPAVHIIPHSRVPEMTQSWHARIAMDWGVSAPCVTLFGGWAPGDVPGIPKDTIVVFDEISTHDPRDLSLNTGLGWPPSKVGEAIEETVARWNIHAHGVADDSVGLHGPTDTLIRYFSRDHRIHFQKPVKGRVSGWSLIRNRLQATRDRTGKPGLLISDRCSYLLATLPICMRDPKRPEDLDTSGPDHGLDALRYLVNSAPRFATVGRRAGSSGPPSISSVGTTAPVPVLDPNRARQQAASDALRRLHTGNF